MTSHEEWYTQSPGSRTTSNSDYHAKCAACAEQESEIARLTHDTEQAIESAVHDKVEQLYEQALLIGKQGEEIAHLKAATRRLMEAAMLVIRGAPCWTDVPEATLIVALADPVLAALRRE
jgi:hypothetical protein